MVFKTSIRVSWQDTDAAGVVHFSNYFRFFEKCEEEIYRSLGFDYDSVTERYGIWLPRAEAFCKYRAPCKFNELIDIEIYLEELKEKSVRYGFRFYRHGSKDLIAEGYVTVVSTSKRTGKAVALPREISEKLASFFSR